MNHKIHQLLVETFNSKFLHGILDTDDVGVSSDALDVLSETTYISVSDILQYLYNFQPPKEWNRVIIDDDKVNSKVQIIQYTHSGSGTPTSVKRILQMFINDLGFKEYNCSDEPYAFVNNTKVKNERYNWYNGHDKQERELLRQWVQKFDTFPKYVKNLFKTDPKYKTILLSPDNGIAIIRENDIDTTDKPKYQATYETYTIVLTGEVDYLLTDKKVNVDNYKERQNKQKFLDFFVGKTSKTFQREICKHMVFDKDGTPYYVSFFNMNDDKTYIQQAYKNSGAPHVLVSLKSYGFNFLSKLEYDDDSSKWEMFNKCLHAYIYDHIPDELISYINDTTKVALYNDCHLNTKVFIAKNMVKRGYSFYSPIVDSCILIKLDSYALDIYHEKFK